MATVTVLKGPTTDAVVDRVAAALTDETFEIIATNLSAEHEANLRAAFA